MALHKDLTGAELHEPKGADTAADRQIYVADGAGSGAWEDKFEGVLNLNEFWLNGYMTDVSTANSRVYFYVPVQSEIFELSAIINNAITTADATLSVYINGVLFPESLLVEYTGSASSDLFLKSFTTPNTIAAGSVVEVRSNGSSDTTAPTHISIGLRAK